ncbi:MAG: hypothetical protein AB7N61_19105 [Acidimicrobiia bacterium]
MNDVRNALLARPLVHDLWSSAVAGCWEIEHDHDDVAAMTELMRQSLHGWKVADNGEIIMMATNPTITDRCAWHSREPSQGG